MLNLCDFIQVYVFTTNHHLKECMDNIGILKTVLKRKTENDKSVFCFG